MGYNSMIRSWPYSRRKTFLACLVIGLGLYGGLMLACYWLMARGRAQASTSMDRICAQILGPGHGHVIEQELFSTAVRTSFNTSLAEMQPLKSVTYSIEACQISGLPCLALLTLRTTHKTKKLMLYFYGDRCRHIEAVSN
jgi:hypothetical protein